MSFEEFRNLVHERRTVKEFNGKAVAKSTLEKLVELAVWAPNHRLNQPWRFSCVSHEKIAEWIRFLESHIESKEFLPLKSGLERLKNVGAVIVVSVEASENEIIHEENYAAACAAVQNILLGATALGLQSFWSTGKAMLHSQSRVFLKIPENERFVGAVWLGEGQKTPAKDRRPVSDVIRWI